MRPKVAEQVPDNAWKILEEIKSVLKALPDEIEFPAYVLGVRVATEIAVSRGIPNCHAIAHALTNFFPVNVHDGLVRVMGPSDKIRLLEHSWLTLTDHDQSIIIDPWPLGAATGPAIFIQDYAYHFGPECSFLNHKDEEFLSEVETLTVLIARTLERVGCEAT